MDSNSDSCSVYVGHTHKRIVIAAVWQWVSQCIPKWCTINSTWTAYLVNALLLSGTDAVSQATAQETASKLHHVCLHQYTTVTLSVLGTYCYGW